jgi:hypothetical protein
MATGTIIPPSLPANYCPTTWQAFTNYILSKARVVLPDGDLLFVVQEEEPDAEDRDKIWFRIVDDAPDRWYKYYNGEWVVPHEVPASGAERRLYFGNEQSLESYDGGDGDAAGDASGPMWEIDTAPAARFLLAAGTLPSGTVVIPGSTGGHEEITLTEAQLPAHDHTYTGKGDTGASGDGGAAWVGDGNDDLQTGETGDGEEVNILPPYYGTYIIKRTARIYRKV